MLPLLRGLGGEGEEALTHSEVDKASAWERAVLQGCLHLRLPLILLLFLLAIHFL